MNLEPESNSLLADRLNEIVKQSTAPSATRRLIQRIIIIVGAMLIVFIFLQVILPMTITFLTILGTAGAACLLSLIQTIVMECADSNKRV